MNQHESYTSSILLLHFCFSEVSIVVIRVVVSHQLLTQKFCYGAKQESSVSSQVLWLP